MDCIRTLLLTAMTTISLSCSEALNDSEHILYYGSPAKAWEERLPIGNGRMGMMPDGDPSEEHIILNEISLWSGCEADYANPDAAESLPEIRQALLEGRNSEAQKIMYERFVPRTERYNGTYGSYQVLGQLMVMHQYKDSTTAEDYRRWLDLREATSYSSYRIGEVRYEKKYYVSRQDDVMAIEMKSSEPGSINMEITLDRADRAEVSMTEDGLLKLHGNLDSGTEAPGMGYCAYAKVIAEGKLEALSGASPSIRVSGADKVWILISAATDYFTKDYDKAALERLDAIDSKKIKSLHRILSQHIRNFISGTPCPSAAQMKRQTGLQTRESPDMPKAEGTIHLRHSIIISEDTSSSAAPVPAVCLPIFKGYGQIRSIHHGTETTTPTSMSR